MISLTMTWTFSSLGLLYNQVLTRKHPNSRSCWVCKPYIKKSRKLKVASGKL